VQHDLSAEQPDWDFQELIAADSSAVALRVTKVIFGCRLRMPETCCGEQRL